MKPCEQITLAAEQLVHACAERGLTIATAESCTAGMVASAIGDIPGASAVLRGGAVTYCDEIKHAVLGVSSETLDAHTAVSGQTACEMALGARRLFGADIAVSLTGYAGPGGGSASDPVGTVYIGYCDACGVSSARFIFKGSRSEVRLQAAACALETMLDKLENL